MGTVPSAPTILPVNVRAPSEISTVNDGCEVSLIGCQHLSGRSRVVAHVAVYGTRPNPVANIDAVVFLIVADLFERARWRKKSTAICVCCVLSRPRQALPGRANRWSAATSVP